MMAGRGNARFGERRLVRDDVSLLHRLLYRLIGPPDPADFAHWRDLQRALETIAAFAPRRVLDAGCGGGDHTLYLARRYPSAAVEGIDLLEPLLSQCRTAARRLGIQNVVFRRADIAQLPGTGTYDLVVCMDVLEHIREQTAALRQLHDVLVPGGWLYCHVPVRREAPVPLDRHLKVFHAWAEVEHVAEERTAEAFMAGVRDAGLEIVRYWHTFGYWSAELATSLFNLGYSNSAGARVWQAAVAPLCHALVLADHFPLPGPRYALGVLARRTA